MNPLRNGIVLAVALAASSLAAAPAAPAPAYAAELIFPPEAFHNHSSSIVETPGGDLLACWFHGKSERTDNTLVILGARKKQGAPSWSAPFLLADNKGLPDQNCTLFIDPQGRLTLYRSTDEGKTWPAQRPLENLDLGTGTGSYPTLIEARDGSIHVTYTHEDKKSFAGKTIKHAWFNEAWITAGAR